jgi:hypothetical protein
MNYSELMLAHRYAEVAAACEEGLKASSDDIVLLAWHARAMLGLGRLPEALEEQHLAHAEAERSGPPPPDAEGSVPPEGTAPRRRGLIGWLRLLKP